MLLLILLGLGFLSGCEPEEQQGDGQLPEKGAEVVADFVKQERFDETGGRIVYVQDAPATDSGETQWCVNVRYVNSEGLSTIPLLVRQSGEEWRLERNPDRMVYEGYGCTWP
jgi:hypothetical protein